MDHIHRSHHNIKTFGELHVIAVCFNPVRFASRYGLFKEFAKMAGCAGAKVHIAELSFGERPEEIDFGCETQHWKFRTKEELWHKEALINAAVSRLPHDWKYVAWIDADVAFTNPHWVQETLHQLQHYSVVQMFHTAIDLSPRNLPLKTFVGFPASMVEHPELLDQADSNRSYYYHGGAHHRTHYYHPGYAWACTREAWDTMGGLLDINIVGGGDHQMAHAFYGNVRKAIPHGTTPSYRNAVLGWQSHALLLKQNIGFVDGTLLHYWHGKKQNRGYFDRWKILSANKYDPVKDLRHDWQGLLQLAGNKPKLRDDLRAYFRQRNEDSIDVL